MSMFKVVLNEGKGTVEAVNYSSAEIQFKWLLAHKECFCKGHCIGYYRDYGVIMNPLNNECLTPLNPTGGLSTPLDSSWGMRYIGGRRSIG